MSTARKIAKNTTILFISQIITYVIGFFITLYTARYLGVEGFGILSLALALTGIYIIFNDLGLNTLTVREVSRDKSLQKKYVGNTIVLKLIFSASTFLITVLTVYIVHYPDLVKDVIYIITISYIFNAFSGIFYAIFQSHQEMEHQSIVTVLNSVVMITGVLLAIYYHLDVIAFAFIYLIANGVNLAYILIAYSWKFSLPKIEVDLNFWKSTLKNALPMAITSIFAVLVFRVDTVMLSLFKAVTAVGFYAAAQRLMEALIFFPAVYTTSIFPVFSTFYVSSKSPLNLAYEKSFKYLTILSLPIAVGITFLASPIILLIYKSAYTPSILALQILAWVLPFIFVNYILGSLLTAMDRQYTLLKITAVCLIFNVGLNLIFIPYFSFLGAAFVTVITEVLSVILSFYVVSQLVSKIKVHRIIFKPIIACLVMALFLYYFKMNLFIAILISTIIYFGVLILLRTFKEEDYDLFRAVLKR